MSEQNALAIQAENDRLKAEIEQQKLREQAAAGQGQGKAASEEWIAHLVGQVEKLQSQVLEAQRALTEQQVSATHDQLQMLSAELQQVQAQREATPTGVAAARQAIEEARGLVELLQPTTALPPPTTHSDPALAAWQLRAQLDQRRWEAEREDRHSERLAELEMQRQTKQDELAILRERNGRLDRFMVETAPKLVELGQNLLVQLLSRSGNTPPVAAAASVAPPAGAEAARCQSCGATLFYKPAWREVICQRCGAEYQLTPPTASNPPPSVKAGAPPPAVESPRADPPQAGQRPAADPDEGANIA